MENQEVGFDFGLGWDPQASLMTAMEEEQARREKRPLDSLKPKLTPAQKRDAALKELKDAVIAQDEELVHDVLLSHPKLEICNTPFELEKAVLTHFNPAIAQMCLDRGMLFNFYGAIEIFMSVNSMDALKYLYDHFSAPVPSTDTARQKKHADQLETMKYLYTHCMKELGTKTSSDKKMLNKNYRDFLEEKFPNIFTQFATKGGLTVLLDGVTVKSPPYEKELLWRTKNAQWAPVFEQKFSMRYFQHGSKSFNAEKMHGLHQLMNEFPFLKPAFEQAMSQLAEKHAERQAWVERFLGDAQDPKDTLFYKEVQKVVITSKGQLSYYSHAGRTDQLLSSAFSVPSHYQKFMNVVGWNNVELSRFMDMGGFRHNFSEYQRKDGTQSPVTALPSYEPLSFLHLLVAVGSPVLTVLANDEHAHASILNCLSDEDTAHLFTKNVAVQDLANLIKKMPQLVDWRDKYGNTLGHLVCVVQSEVTKTGAQALLRAAHSWFGTENSNGMTLRDVYEKMGAADTTVTEIDKMMMKKELVMVDDIRKKVHSRNTKRRM